MVPAELNYEIRSRNSEEQARERVMQFRKETAGAAIFCIVNGILSMNCLFYHFVRDKAVSSERASEREIPVKELSKEAMENPLIEIGNVNRILFPFEDGRILCTDLQRRYFEVFLSDKGSGKCTMNKDAVTVETEFIHFPKRLYTYMYAADAKLRILYNPEDRANFLAEIMEYDAVSYIEWGKDTVYRSKEISETDFKKKLGNGKLHRVILLMDVKDRGMYGIVPKEPVLNYSSFILAAHLSTKMERSTSLWHILEPPAFVIDVVTFPIQFIGGWLYIIIFGFKK